MNVGAIHVTIGADLSGLTAGIATAVRNLGSLAATARTSAAQAVGNLGQLETAANRVSQSMDAARDSFSGLASGTASTAGVASAATSSAAALGTLGATATATATALGGPLAGGAASGTASMLALGSGTLTTSERIGSALQAVRREIALTIATFRQLSIASAASRPQVPQALLAAPQPLRLLTAGATEEVNAARRRLLELQAVLRSAASSAAAFGGRTVAALNGIAAAANRAADRIDQAREKFAGLTRAGEAFKSVGRGLTIGLTVPLAALGGLAIRSATQLDSLKRGLTAVAGSSAEAEIQLKRLAEVAKLPGLGFREAIQGSIRLQAAGFSAGLAEDALRGFGNALATVGAGKAELDQVTRALSQIAAKGKVSAEEINQLAEVLPQIRTAMKAAFGTANTELIQQSGIEAQQFVRAITDELLKLEQVTGGPANAFENLSDSLFRASAAIGDSLMPAVLPLVDGLSALLTEIRAVNPETVRWGIAIAGVVAAFGPLALVVGTAITAVTSLASALLAITAAGTLAIGVVIGAPLLLGLAALSALFVKNKLDSLAAAGAVDQYAASLNGLSSAAATEKLGDLTRQADELRRKIATLPATVGKLTTLSASGATAGSVQIANPEVVRLKAELAEINQQTGTVIRRMTDLRTAGTSAARAVVAPFDAAGAAAGAAGRKVKEFGQAVKDVAAENLARLTEQLRVVDRALETKAIGSRALAATPNITPTIIGFEVDQAALDRVKQEIDTRLKLTPLLDLEMKEVRAIPQAATNNASGGLFAGLKEGVSGVVDQLKDKFSPALLVAAGAFAILTPVFQALRDAVGPAINALAVPLRVVGAVLGTLLVPVLQLLFPVFKAVGIVAAMLGESFAALAGWFLDGLAFLKEALGRFVIAIGKFINILPGSLGNPLIKYGENLIDGAEKMKGAAANFREMSRDFDKTQEELRGLTWEDAMTPLAETIDATTLKLDKFGESLSNVPELFDLALRRRQSAMAGGGYTAPIPGWTAPTDTGGGGSIPTDRPLLAVYVNAESSSVDATRVKRDVLTALDAPEVKLKVRQLVDARGL